ncbi:MAG: sulfatase-like hydrolase/transferase, partial [Vicinamibacteria bacterium]|nr:sulfatase-like hydrolase/transferase [Vicinamibacteria bacterium]
MAKKKTKSEPAPVPASATREKGGRSAFARTVLAVAGALFLGGLALYALQSRAVKRNPKLSILLITIDTLRADALGIYGGKAETPWIDRLAREGVRFETAHSHNVVTFPSHANILSGQLPLIHGVHDNTGFRFPADLPTIATRLKALGFRTAAFVSAFVLDSRFGLDRGFDLYDDRTTGLEAQSPFRVPDRLGPETVAAAKTWLDAQGDSQFFA